MKHQLSSFCHFLLVVGVLEIKAASTIDGLFDEAISGEHVTKHQVPN